MSRPRLPTGPPVESSTPEEKSLDWPLDAKPLLIPHAIELRGDGLAWKWNRSRLMTEREATVVPGRGLFTGFLRLDAPESILAYARRWGVLEVCKEHRAPGGHPKEMYIPRGHCGPQKTDDGWMWEPLSVWNYTIQSFQAMSEVARLLQRGKLPSAAGWSRLYVRDPSWTPPYPVMSSSPRSVEQAWNRIASRLIAWLRIGSVKPYVTVRPKGIAVELGGYGLFGALAAEMLIEVSRTEGLVFCSACGKPYVPDSRPALSKNRFCQSCGRPAALRQAARAYKQRVERARQLRSQGVPVEDIAKQLGRPLKRVKTWVSAR